MKDANQTSKFKGCLVASFVAWLVVGGAGFLFPAPGEAGALGGDGCRNLSKRPLSDFLDAQGTSSSFFFPVRDYVGWADAAFTTFALVDYAGLANEYVEAETGQSLGTEASGRVIECELADGRAKISVVLSTRRALGFAQSLADLEENGFDFLGTPTIFGAKAQDVVNGADAALGPVSLSTSFTIAAPGDPLPDFINVAFDSATYAPVTLDLRSTTVGTLPDGTRARLRVQQVASTNADGELVFSREIVDLNREN